MGSNRSFGNGQSIAVDVPNAAYRAYDVVYMDVGDNALIAYENSTASDRQVMYRIWNGTGLSQEFNITVPIETPVNWVGLFKQQGTDQIMMVVLNTLNDLAAIPERHSVQSFTGHKSHCYG